MKSAVFLHDKQRQDGNHLQPQEMLEYERQHEMTVDDVAQTVKISISRKHTYSAEVTCESQRERLYFAPTLHKF